MKIILSEEKIVEAVKNAINEYYDSHGQYTTQRCIAGVDRYYKMKWDYSFLFGRYRGKSVETIFNDRLLGKEYLIWAYYNLDNTDYAPEIIEALGIEPIDKPGSNPELGKEYKHKYIDSLSDDEKKSVQIGFMRGRKKTIDYNRRVQAASDVANRNIDKSISGKSKLAWKNQGH